MTEQAKIALVTGASRGIGRAIAIGMAKRGFDVAINDIERQQDALQEVARAIEATSRRALTVYADVSNKAQVEAMVSNVVDVFGRIDALVNNAGILIAGDVEHLKEEHWDSVLDVNAKGTFLVVIPYVPTSRARTRVKPMTAAFDAE